MITFKDILDYCQAEAIANKLQPTEDSTYRQICRTYSKLFHTPLTTVLELDAVHVIQNVYEEQIQDLDEDKFENMENMLETLLGIEDPDYIDKKETKLEKDIEKYEREEEDRVRSGRAIHPSLKKKTPTKTLSENPKEPVQEKRTGGSVDFSSLNDEDES